MNSRHRFLPGPRALTLLALSLALPVRAQDKPKALPQLSLEELLNVKLTVASRSETTVLEAPSVVSVFTAEDIHRMGARDLRDVLRTVPGFEVGVRAQLGYTEFGVRGIMTASTEKVRILVDGVPVNENLEGSGTIVFGDMALDNVQQIEIIRGPGSALYGTNAFLAVVSIITKDASGSGAGSTLSLKGGSFNSKEGSFLTGWSGPKLRVSAYLHYLDTDGPESPIERDALQTDPNLSPLNSGISLAGTPRGHTHEFRRRLSTQIKAEYEGFTLNGYFLNAHKGPYLGTLYAVNEHSDAHPTQLQGAIGYTFHPGDNWVIEPKIYALHYTADNRWNDAPEGFTVPGPIVYTQGSYQINRATQQTRGAEVKTTWALREDQKVIFGVSAEEEKLYQIINYVNVPGYGLDNMVETPPIMKKAPVRTLTSAYLQDQWTPAKVFSLTAGLRMDRYNDAGTSITPRVAAVWHPVDEVHIKAMYGEAFRAPTFVESYLYVQTGPNTWFSGRENNQPEKIRTGEVEVGWRLGDVALWRVALFQNRIRNLIQIVPTASGQEYQNVPDVTVVKGVETELKATFSEVLSGFVNYSAQSGRNEGTGQVLAGMANWRGNVGLNVAPLERLNINAALGIVGRRQRLAGDTRPELKGYSVADLTFNYMLNERFDLSLSAHNAFDADQRTVLLNPPLPGDLPGEGRSFQAGLRWRF